MPNSTNPITKLITIAPYSFGDADCAVEEWFEDFDPNEEWTLDNIEIKFQQFEKYEATITPRNDGSHILEEIGAPLTIGWVVEEVGTLEECLEFVKNCPGTGYDCRIRKADRDWMVAKNGELRIVPNTESAPDEYWVEERGGCGHEAWEQLHSGTYQECYVQMIMKVAEQQPNTKFRIRPVETHSVTYEHVENGLIIAEVTMSKK